jgi:hypothetical protein
MAEAVAVGEPRADEEAIAPRVVPRLLSRLWRRTSVVVAAGLTPLSVALLWAALVLPDRLDKLGFTAFLRLPVELLVVVALGMVPRRRVRQAAALLFGGVVGVLVVLKALDMGFYTELDRPFDPVVDLSSFGPAVGVLRDSIGRDRADALVVGAVALFTLVIVLLALASARVAEAAARQRPFALRASGVLGLGWLGSTSLSLSLVVGIPLASDSAASLAAREVHTVSTSLHDEQVFAATLATRDPAARIPAANLLSGLRGKDVVLAFVESYGEVAVRGTDFSRGVDGVLRQGTAALRRAGFGSRSALLTSPTFGGISWLAHSTLQTGLWIDNQLRYDQVLNSNRITLSGAFKQAGWRTVSDVPSDAGAWPQGRAFYHFDQMYNAHNVGYRGPRFSYARIPDEYTLATLQHLELGPGHPPVMAEVDLDSSHTPWTPLPRFLPWNQMGDGSVYASLPRRGGTPTDVWRRASDVQRMYGLSVQYALRSLVTFVTRSHDKNLVVILLGDHQPSTTVSGVNATHNVPITIVAHDPSVLRRASSWDWQPGMLPGLSAPTWPMDAFRNRFLDAFSSPVG